MCDQDDTHYELMEAHTEIERHHRDFERISKAIDRAIALPDLPRYREALYEIRGIVG